MSFMGDDFLLSNEPAKKLYHEYAEHLPIIDYHCHIQAADIAEDKQYDSISDIWLGGDHYKWRLLRANGVQEEEITGSNDPYRLFEHFAATLPRAVGNPVFHWSYLELKRYFGVDGILNKDTARAVYDQCNERLRQKDMSVRQIIKKSKVELICTTDDPIDDLAYHKQIARDPGCEVKVLPAFRPDQAIRIDAAGYVDYIDKLARVSGVEIKSFSDLKEALDKRIDFFNETGCRTSDHALESIIFAPANDEAVNEIFTKALAGEKLAKLESEIFRTALLLHLGKRYHELGWVMQLHFGSMRNNNKRMFDKLGPDTGFDAMNGSSEAYKLSYLMNAMEEEESLPKMILYSLNPSDNEIITSIAGCFMADAKVAGKIQLGSAWWFNDTKSGMEKQLLDVANGTLLANFVGMLTDSRSFLSYTRHEYFRRILCNFIGKLISDGEYPEDYETIGHIVSDICYYNTRRFFDFDPEQ